MFTMTHDNWNVPIHVWLSDESQVDALCMEQASHLARLPFLHKRVCLMPDTHAGMGMPIGGVIATEGVIIPNAVGVDIGCGMAFCGTDIPVERLREQKTGGSIVEGLIADILRSIPVGFSHHKNPQSCYTLDAAYDDMELYIADTPLCGQLEAGYYQVGTLGGGNHFIELQEDQDGCLGIMVHSGSRNFGKQVCDYFHRTARDLNLKWHSEIPDEWRLAFLPLDSAEGRQYVNWMNLALAFAAENRARMMYAVRSKLEKWMAQRVGVPFQYTEDINCHHNYAALERHGSRDVWVHRKGATRAQAGELAVIPGAMGSFSYVVEGLGNKQSFCSSSHGAGRQYSRKGAMQAFSAEEVMTDLAKRDVVLGKHNKKDVAEESRFAYKDIDEVMDQQKDLVKPLKKLRTIGVVKG